MWVVVVRLLFDCFWVNLKWKECRRTIQMRWEEPTTPPSLMANYYCENLKAIRITKTEISMRNRYGRLAIIFGNFWIRLEKIEHPYKSSGFICRQALRAKHAEHEGTFLDTKTSAWHKGDHCFWFHALSWHLCLLSKKMSWSISKYTTK